jgi:WD40 repeat protein
MWRVEDCEQMATLPVRNVECVGVSKDGRWIAAGTVWGEVFVWDAKTFEQVFSHRESDYCTINGVDFSPDSSRLVSASGNGTAVVRDTATRKRVHTLDHKNWLIAAKYSPEGDRIATATNDYIRVWDSNDDRLLVDIPVTVTSLCNTGHLWFNNHLFVISGSKIKQFEASTGSTVSEWPVPIAASSRASLYQSMGNSSHTQHSVPSHFGTPRHTPNSVSSNTLKTFVQSQSHQTTAFSQSVERTGTSVCPASL